MVKQKVLIVEDENIIALDIKRTLVKLGYEPVGTVATGERAIDMTRSENPNVILMDINLKGSLNGVEAAKVISSERNIPIIFLSALNTITQFPSFNTIKFAGHLTKPFEEKELEDTLHKALFPG